MTEYGDLTREQEQMAPQDLINYCMEKWRELGEIPVVRVIYKSCTICGEKHRNLKPFDMCKMCYGSAHKREIAIGRKINVVEKQIASNEKLIAENQYV